MHEQIKKIMAVVFNLSEQAIPDNAAFNELPGWDSLGHITLMMAIEQELGIELSAEAMLNAVTLPSLEDFVKECFIQKERQS